jgi:hypothetical protein
MEVRMIEFSPERIHQLKGAQLAVLMLLGNSPEPVTQRWLQCWSGYSEKSVQNALDDLREFGLAVRSQDGWCAADAMQMPQSTRKISAPINIINNNDLNKDSDVNNNNNSANRENSNPEPATAQPRQAVTASETPEEAELWQMLAEIGVRRNHRTCAMLRLEHVNEKYLRAKIAEYQEQGLSGTKWAGLFIRAIESGEPPPPLQANGHPLKCPCPACTAERFFGR